jgi:hypothetical protein
MSVEIKAGSELDRAVAEAIGWRQSGEAWVNKETPLDRECWMSDFSPSTDLNAAFAAAEKVGLFETRLLRQVERNLWEVIDIHAYVFMQERGGCDAADCAFGSTPALAICAAILKLREADV